MQQKEITNDEDFSGLSAGRIIALDLGTKRIGVAICDEFQLTVRPLDHLKRRTWKELLKDVKALVENYDAVALVVGLPLHFHGAESDMSDQARRFHRNFGLSLKIPVFLQDERLTTNAAKELLTARSRHKKSATKNLDSDAAAIILSDFLDRKRKR